jgi:hypothetical protein
LLLRTAAARPTSAASRWPSSAPRWTGEPGAGGGGGGAQGASWRVAPARAAAWACFRFAAKSAGRGWQQAAEHIPPCPRFAEAAAIYEDTARAAAENNLLRFGARGHLLCAGVCVLCYGSDEDVRARIERYKDIDLQVWGWGRKGGREQQLAWVAGFGKAAARPAAGALPRSGCARTGRAPPAPRGAPHRPCPPPRRPRPAPSPVRRQPRGQPSGGVRRRAGSVRREGLCDGGRRV